LRFFQVRLLATAARLPQLANFYGRQLGFERHATRPDAVGFAVGETDLEFVASVGEPFYHFALLVPGNRFDAALRWARLRTTLLPDADTGEVVFDFDNWGARACYFHDPAGNIVELIAHRGISEADLGGEFTARELIGFSELGLVGDPATMAEALEKELGLELWDGTVTEPGRLAFMGERARTLILSAPNRGWLPTGRPAVAHRIMVHLAGAREKQIQLEDTLYDISQARPGRQLLTDSP
jgi:catechol 2,3-dioxygenase-like lactoylglutathione lyase family enzyme